jgi:NitT/TauT family transport system ATP-binding protein
MSADSKKTVLDVQISRRLFQMADGGQLHAVGELSFQLKENSFTCIVGPSGCGKTTTLRSILGLDTQFEGSIVQPDPERLAAVFQEPRLLPWRTVEQNVRLVLPKSRKQESLEALFNELGLLEVSTFYPSQLSLGLARRVALARAFVLHPDLLILDEPFVSLDDATATRLRNVLLELWKAHATTALMVTHNMLEAAQLADRILVFSSRPARVVDDIELPKLRSERTAADLNSVVARISRASKP